MGQEVSFQEFSIRLLVGQWGRSGFNSAAQGCLNYAFWIKSLFISWLPFSLWVINVAPTHSEGLQGKMFIQEL